MGFQKKINYEPALACEGDFASVNPTATVLAGRGCFTVGVGGATVGRFGWADPVTGKVTNHSMAGYKFGFIRRENQARITQWLGESSMLAPEGMEITLFSSGDFWARFAGGAEIGQKVFADTATGECKAGAAGETIAGAIETPWYVASLAGAGELAKITTWEQ